MSGSSHISAVGLGKQKAPGSSARQDCCSCLPVCCWSHGGCVGIYPSVCWLCWDSTKDWQQTDKDRKQWVLWARRNNHQPIPKTIYPSLRTCLRPSALTYVPLPLHLFSICTLYLYRYFSYYKVLISFALLNLQQSLWRASALHFTAC